MWPSYNNNEELMMKLKTLSIAMMSVAFSSTAVADELLNMQEDAHNWVMPAGNYNNQRYSKLTQINKENVKDLKMAWSFSTGVLRGHEGNSLVIDGTMYVHTVQSSGNMNQNKTTMKLFQ